MPKKKVIISACLLGEVCRYDGQTKQVNEVIEAFREYEIIPFCPEAPLFGTPRQRISVVQKEAEKRIITDETNEDVTQKLQEEISSFINKHSDVSQIILKSKSPSCGIATTPVLNEERKITGFGDGIAVALLREKYPNATLCDENSSIKS
ncbi:DUF523 domain-containing protein [bacterium]|nr:DUF523 domain-containing protein [bacterium]